VVKFPGEARDPDQVGGRNPTYYTMGTRVKVAGS